MLLALLLIFIFCNLADAETYSIAYFPSDSFPMDFTVKVDGANALVVTSAVDSQYYNFDYDVGQSLELFSIPDQNQLGYFLIKNGAGGAGKTIYNSRAMTFFIVNKCPNNQQSCELAVAGHSFDSATADVYFNERRVIDNFNGGFLSVTVQPDEVIKVLLTGSPDSNASMRFNFLNIPDNSIEYGGPTYWLYQYLVTAAVIETVGITSPKDGAVIYATPAGRSIDIKLSSTPLPALYNVEVGCPSFPPFSQLILSTTAAVQSINIPPEYDSRNCLIKVVDTISGVNSVIVVITLSRVEIDQFLWSLGVGSRYLKAIA